MRLSLSAKFTQSRIEALRNALARMGSDRAILWLVGFRQSTPALVTSYCVGFTDEDVARFYNTYVDLSALSSYIQDASKGFESAVGSEVAKWMVAQSLDPAQYAIFPIARPIVSEGIQEQAAFQNVAGFVAISKSTDHRQTADFSPVVAELAFRIETGRSERLIDSIRFCQGALADATATHDELLTRFGELLRFELGSESCLVVNERSGLLVLDGAVLDPASIPVSIEAILTTVAFEKPRRACQFTIDGNERDGSAESIQVLVLPFGHQALLLSAMPFSDGSAVLEKLAKAERHDSFIVFIGKAVEGYLQSHFSQSDIIICDAIAEINKQFLSTKTGDDGRDAVQAAISVSPIEIVHSPAEVLRILSTMSCHFTELAALDIELYDQKMEIDLDPTSMSDLVSPMYIERLNSKYLARISQDHKRFNAGHVLVGVDLIEGEEPPAFRLEFHLPAELDASKIYVARYEGATIPSAIFKVVSFLFAELHIQARRLANQRERASYLTQVRHALIHHISAAHSGIVTMKKVWDRGTRNREYWSQLWDDPILPKQLGRALSSLTQGRLLMENGRFLIGEIDPSSLNRKPMRIAQIIEDSLSALNAQRLDRSLTVVSKIRGFPKPMNGDAGLMGIAITNLLDNAFKYSRHRKKVLWTIEYREESYVFQVSNLGSPLDPDAKNRYFEVGYRGRQRDRLNQRHGTGLGLPVAYKILKAHSLGCELDFSHVEHDSELGGPSITFQFEMPYLTGSSSDGN